MHINICDTLMILTGIQVILAASEETPNKQINFHYCSDDLSIGPEFVKKELEANFTCQCRGGLLEKQWYYKNGYTYTPGVGYHKLHTTARTWNEARKVCIEEKGHLAIINSKLEESILVDMLKKAANKISDSHCRKTAYLGIHDMFQEGDWVTVLGEPLSSTGYTYWSPNYFSKQQPDNGGGNQNCGTLLTKTGMDDDVCCRKYAFFCELPLMKYEWIV